MLRSLQGDRAFQRLRKGRSGGAKHLSVRLRPARHGQVRLGVVVSRKVGKAVVRNRVRRRLREAMLALLRAPARPAAAAPERSTTLSNEPSGASPGSSGPLAAAGSDRPTWPSSFDVLVLTRPSAAEADYHELSRSLATAIDRAVAAPATTGGRPGRRSRAAPASAGAA
jgi:ribonuclease P protein component